MADISEAAVAQWLRSLKRDADLIATLCPLDT